MRVETVEGICCITAPWLKEPVYAPTFHEAYWLAVAARH
jgi:hypothetical protein